MSAAVPAQDQWADVQGAHIGLFCWVKQVIGNPEPSMLPDRLGHKGQVLGRGPDRLYVRFDDQAVVSVSPALLCVLPDAPGEC